MSPFCRQGAQCPLLPRPLEAVELVWSLSLSPGFASGPEVFLGCVPVCVYEHRYALGVSQSLGVSSLGFDRLKGLKSGNGEPCCVPRLILDSFIHLQTFIDHILYASPRGSYLTSSSLGLWDQPLYGEHSLWGKRLSPISRIRGGEVDMYHNHCPFPQSRQRVEAVGKVWKSRLLRGQQNPDPRPKLGLPGTLPPPHPQVFPGGRICRDKTIFGWLFGFLASETPSWGEWRWVKRDSQRIGVVGRECLILISWIPPIR